MANVGVFDVLGPIMIGPSSSHTAGAARLGKMASMIVGKEIKEVNFLLHGSFGQTYKGHGTDRALVAGILKMDADDRKLKDALELAKKKGIQIRFTPTDLGQVHPNTVEFLITDVDGGQWKIQGSSIGGGLVEINLINEYQVHLTGERPTLITSHKDIPGTVAKISEILYEGNMNIATMTLARSQRGLDATMTIEVDGDITEKIVSQIRRVEGIKRVIVIQ